MPQSPKIPILVTRRRGFSLVLSLTVMAMLLLLCVGGAAMLAMELRVGRATIGYTRARLNALAGARIAMGELQRLAGPDQRISATADLLTKNDFQVDSVGKITPGPLEQDYYKDAKGAIIRHPRWTGIWHSGKVSDKSLPDVAKVAPGEEGKVVQRDTEGSLNDSRLQNGAKWEEARASSDTSVQSHRFLGWLVSGNEARPAWDPAGGDDGLVTPYTTISNNKDAILVGNGTLGQNFKPTDTTSDMLGARARIVSLKDASDALNGSYAFWIADEGVKAKLNIIDRMPQGKPSASDPNGAYRRLLTSQRNRFPLAKGTDGVERLAGLDTLPASTAALLNSMQSIQLASLGDSSGALDYSSNYFHDISFVSKGLLTDNVNGGLKRDLTAYLSGQDTATKGAYQGMADTDPILTGPNFTPFCPKYSYLKNWITQAPAVAATSASNIFPQTSAAPQWGGMPYRSPDYTNQPTPLRMPVLTQMQYYLSGATWNSPQGPKAGYAIAPLVTIWNPYPVSLPITGLSAHVIYSGNFNGGIRYRDAAGAGAGLGLSFGGYGAGPMTKFALPDMVLAPGESVTFGAPNTVTDMTASSSFSPLNNPVTQQGKLAPISASTGFFFVNKATPQQAADIMNDPGAYWNESSGWQGFANLNGSTQQMLLLSGNTAIRQVMFEAWSDGNGYAKTYFQWLYSGLGENGRARVLSLPNDKAYALTYPGSESFSVGWRMMCVDEPQAKAAPGIVKNRNLNSLVQWNFNAPKFTRNPFDGNSQQRSANTANGGLFVFETDPNLYSAAHTSPLLYNSNLAPTQITPIDVPRKEWGVWSLAQLQHCPMSQLSWQPALAVGNSFPCQSVGSGSSSVGDNGEKYRWGNTANAIFGGIGGMPEFQTDFAAAKTKTKNGAYPHYLFDLCYEVNKDLFDSWHVSGVGMGGETKGVAWSPGIWEPTAQNCPNSRYVSTGIPHACPSPLYAAAAGMMLDGAFNINSTSQAAWVALLSSAREVSVPTTAGDVATKGQTPFPHHAIPLGKEIASKSTQAYDAAAWSGVRTLSDDEIQVLAAYMVQTVKERGPFLGLSDFVNRRLEDRLGAKSPYAKFVGAIQAAIDKTTRQNQLINDGLEAKDNTAIAHINTNWTNPVQITPLPAQKLNDPVTNAPVWTDSICQTHSRSFTPHAENRVSYKTVGAPGYLTQADVLQHIGTALSARSDTFTVRALGSDADSGASAVVEIVVQRTPAAVYPLNRSVNGDYIPDPAKPAFGRRFVITQTRWLAKDEI